MPVSVTRNKQTLTLKGELDRFNLSDGSLYQFLPFDNNVEIDLAQVSNIDTAGLAYLLKLVGHYQSKGIKVSLLSGSQQLIALANISNVVELLPLSQT